MSVTGEAGARRLPTSSNQPRPDEYFLIGFNSRAATADGSDPRRERRVDKLTFVQTKNNTALYDACISA